jgi:hypothetical protein
LQMSGRGSNHCLVAAADQRQQIGQGLPGTRARLDDREGLAAVGDQISVRAAAANRRRKISRSALTGLDIRERRRGALAGKDATASRPQPSARRESLALPSARRESLALPSAQRESFALPSAERESHALPSAGREALARP